MNTVANPKIAFLALALGLLAALPATSQVASELASKSPVVDPAAGWPRGDWYPPIARRKNIEGKVVVSFALDATGQPHDVAAESTDHPKELEAAALGFVKQLRFRVPAEWTAAGNSRHRFRVEFDLCPFEQPQQGPTDIESVTIRACRVR